MKIEFLLAENGASAGEGRGDRMDEEGYELDGRGEWEEHRRRKPEDSGCTSQGSLRQNNEAEVARCLPIVFRRV